MPTITTPARLAAALCLAGLASLALADHHEDGEDTDTATPAALDFTVETIAGDEQPLSTYAGRVVLVVNVASQCGYTRQYEGLQTLHETYAEQGLSVLGFPANDFGQQEPGTNAEIATFCTEAYDVTFPMFGKVHATGTEMSPFLAHLTANAPAPDDRGPAIRWNFEKFLIDRDGSVIARWRSGVEPTSDDITAAIEAALTGSEDAADADADTP